MTTFPTYLREARILSQQSREELAAKLGTTYARVAKWENGEYLPRDTSLVSIAKALGIDARDLLRVWDRERRMRKCKP